MPPRRLSYSIPSQDLQKAKDASIADLKMVQSEITYDWPLILQDNANPIEMAIALLDDTSVGLAHRLQEFLAIKNRTEGALRNVVDEHYELFSNSIGSYNMLLSALHQSEQDSTAIRNFLESSKREVQDRTTILRELSQSSAKYDEIIVLLDAIKELNKIPDEIEHLIADKKIHEVYDVIANGYKTAEKYGLWSLPAMNTLKTYLEQQSNKLHDMIIDELQNEIYSKNDRSINASGVSAWQVLITSKSPQMASFIALLNSENLEQYVYNSANFDISEVVNYLTQPVNHFLSVQLPELHRHSTRSEGGAFDYKVLLESTSSSSSESYYYIYKLLLTASKLGRLDQVIGALISSNQSELHGLIIRTTEEVKSRNGYALSKLTKLSHLEKDALFDVLAGNAFSDSAVVILQEFFSSIIVKMLATFQKHKVLNEVALLLSGRKSESTRASASASAPASASASAPASAASSNSVSRELMHIWNTTKIELQKLIQSYIHNEEAYTLGNQNNTSLISTKQKNLFKFENVDWSSTKSAQELAVSLSDIFPGFHIDAEEKESRKEEEQTETKDALAMKTPYFEDETFADLLEILVPKNLFNMRIILEPFLIFVEGANRLFTNFATDKKQYNNNNNNNRTAFEFFDKFMKTYFLTYFENAIEFVFEKQIGGYFGKAEVIASEPSGLKMDLVSLSPDSHLRILGGEIMSNNFESKLIIYENAYNFKVLFLGLCVILNTSLTYREEISNMALRTLQCFATEYSKLFQEILASSEGQLNRRPVSQVSKWMKLHVLTEISGDILISNSENNKENIPQLVEAENNMMLFEIKNLVINKDDLLDSEALSQVVHLLLTATWLISWLTLVKKESNYSIYDDEHNESVEIPTVERMRYNWSFLDNGRPSITFTASPNDITQHGIFLALNQEKSIEFERIVNTFEAIRDQTVLALRYELRSKAIHYISLSFHAMEWVPSTEPGDADPYVVALNQEVFAIDNKLTKVLSEDEKEGIFVGFSQFLNELIILKSSQVQKINNNGIKRILLNISTIQQMLRSLSPNPGLIDFNKSSIYFEMFTLNEFNLLNRIKTNSQNFTKDQYYNLARLIYSEKLADGNGSQFNKGKYSELVRKIDESIE
ncbi:SEC8 [Candida oxycetoniae]|uniref:Exocyst complex component Sec8 n=1 Tax=Candida oxycetoniae TaxID=497107 RepID=A0AAI9WW67_9ASCO|nr:SEC8 [Candida oxycetoniae]KAI3402905.2 SEC8 [Candida oxycetoniae]